MEVASSSLVARSTKYICGQRAANAIWRHSQVVRQRTANPPPPGQIWVAPPKKSLLFYDKRDFFERCVPNSEREGCFACDVIFDHDVVFTLRNTSHHRERSERHHNSEGISSFIAAPISGKCCAIGAVIDLWPPLFLDFPLERYIYQLTARFGVLFLWLIFPAFSMSFLRLLMFLF